MDQVRNIVFLGATGAGKSSTCNTIYGYNKGPFPVSHDETSIEDSVVDHTSESKGLRLFDTPGFGDTRLNETQVSKALKGIIFSIYRHEGGWNQAS